MEYCNFKKDELLGRGGFGRVYEVPLGQGNKTTTIAIKEVVVEVRIYR